MEALDRRRGRRIAVAVAQALLAELAKKFVRLLLLRRCEYREMPVFEVQLDRAPVGDFLAAADRIRVFREELIHLLRRPHVKLIAAVAEAIVIAAKFAGVDAKKHVVSVAIGLAQIMSVAGGH